MITRSKKLATTTVASLVLLGGLAGCSKWSEPFKDAPRSNVDNGQPADLIRFPDGFSNAATKCDHGGVWIEYLERYSRPGSEDRPQARLTPDGRVEVVMDAGPRNDYK